MTYIVVGNESGMPKTYAWGPYDTVEEASAVSVAQCGRPHYFHARVVKLGETMISAEALAALTEVRKAMESS